MEREGWEKWERGLAKSCRYKEVQVKHKIPGSDSKIFGLCVSSTTMWKIKTPTKPNPPQIQEIQLLEYH